MPTHCTCGAELPPDARFCHKCGKPQYDMAAQAGEEEPLPQIIVTEAVRRESKPLEINFHNPVAVRTAFLTALITSIISSLPIPPQGLWLLVSLLLAGFLAVFLYTRRTGQPLSMVGGARMGWITGVFSFAIATIFFTLSVVMLSSKGGFVELFRQQLQDRTGGSEAEIQQFLQLLQSPAGLTTVLLLVLAMLFVLFTVFPTLGGALGAKMLERDRA
ncbi:MAG: zinc ribbon domain-containing protein [Bryobacterales bacterium]|nr:zinc ribbon domain-containing protein [Bryobacterales bacterium]